MSKLVSSIVLFFWVISFQVTAYAQDNQPLEIQSEAAVLLDSETGATLYTKNSNQRLYPASLTKIATAIYAIEKGKMDEIVTISERAVNEEGTRVFLVQGEKVPFKKLIQGMLINSGNDAAIAIAEHLDGSVEQFAANLNEYLTEAIGVSDTHFTNPNGLFHENHYTTAMDLAKITNYAKKNPLFSEIFGTKVLDWIGESWETTLLTHHRLLKGEIPASGITGGKTGFVNESKHTLATTAENGGMKLTAIVLKGERSKDTYNDTEKLIQYGFTHFKHRSIKQNELFTYNGKEFYPKNEIIITEPINGSELQLNEKGILEVISEGQVLDSIQLVAKEEPEQIIQTKEEKKPVSSEHNSFSIIGIMVIAFGGLFIGVRRKLVRRQS